MKKQLYIAGILVVISSSVASAQSWKKLSKDVGSKVESVKGGTGLSEDEVGAGLKER